MNYHIVATDDDPAIRKILKIILFKEGNNVSICSNGDELLDLLENTTDHIDCLLLDIKMPGKSGIEVLSIIKEKYPDIPIVMLTAFTDLDTGMNAIRMGASDYLSKPVRKLELLECIERVILKSKETNHKKNSSDIEQQLKLEKQLQDAYDTIMQTTITTIEAFSETIEQKDEYTKGHCSRVRDISLKLASYVQISQMDRSTLEGGALLHDIGKIGVPEYILNKKGRLTTEEFDIIKTHPETGEKILGYIDLFKPYLSIIRNHHEWYDGTGYPDGLSGEDIPLLVRIVSIADAFDAMTSNRSYRAAMNRETATQELSNKKGSQFDPDLVDIFITNKIYLL